MTQPYQIRRLALNIRSASRANSTRTARNQAGAARVASACPAVFATKEAKSSQTFANQITSACRDVATHSYAAISSTVSNRAAQTRTARANAALLAFAARIVCAKAAKLTVTSVSITQNARVISVSSRRQRSLLRNK